MTDEDDSQKLHYVNNADFFKHMKSHITSVKKAKKAKKPTPKVPEFIGECIVSIANKLANKPNFMNYPFREEMIADGIENSLQYLNNFDPQKSSNPFAYFTQIIYYAFVRRIQKEKRHLYTKYRVVEEAMLNDTSDDGSSPVQRYGSDYADINMHEFVHNFEKGQDEKKQKAKKAKENKKVGFDKLLKK